LQILLQAKYPKQEKVASRSRGGDESALSRRSGAAPDMTALAHWPRRSCPQALESLRSHDGVAPVLPRCAPDFFPFLP
jgi:hypothetical protein